MYEVEHLETERHAALKVLLPHVLANEAAREQFKTEAKVAARLKSENVVDVLDAGVDESTDMPYLVMELLEGEDLGARVHRLGRLSPEEAVRSLDQVARALDRVHARSIIHRDLKPENLFLTEREDGSPLLKILDFGIAKVLAGGASSMLTDQARGTPIYMSPEQFQQSFKVSPATDIYSLGMVTFTLLVGDPYWGPELDLGLNVFVIARLAEAGPKQPATERARARGVELPEAFNEWFARITALDPARRFHRASEAIAALAVALDVPLPTRNEWDRPSRPSFTGYERAEGRPSLEPFAAPLSRPSPEPAPSSSARPSEPPSTGRRHAQDAPTLPDLALLQAGAAADRAGAPRRPVPGTASIQEERLTATDRPAVLTGEPVEPAAMSLRARGRAGQLVLAALLAAAVVVIVLGIMRGRPQPSAASSPEPAAPAGSGVASGATAQGAPASPPSAAPASPSAGDVPTAAASVVPSSATASPAGSSAEPAPTAPVHVAPSPGSAAPPVRRPSREVTAGSAPAAPAKKPKYTQD